jgi:hypothetical protein
LCNESWVYPVLNDNKLDDDVVDEEVQYLNDNKLDDDDVDEEVQSLNDNKQSELLCDKFDCIC